MCAHVGRGRAPLKPCKQSLAESPFYSCTSAQLWFEELARVNCASNYSPCTRDDPGRPFPPAALRAAALVLTGGVRTSATCTSHCFCVSLAPLLLLLAPYSLGRVGAASHLLLDL